MNSTLFFDIGAHVGNWAIANSHLADLIIAVEASPKTFKRLINNISTKGLTNITPRCVAICNHNTSNINFWECPTDTLSTLNHKWLSDPSSRFYGYYAEEIKVPCMSLDALIEEYGIPTRIKIDVEGAEYQVIQSLSKPVKEICFEWTAEWREDNIKCIEYLYNKLGFLHFAIQYQDSYTYVPNESEYIHTCASIKNILHLAKDKEDWGMIWCRI